MKVVLLFFVLFGLNGLLNADDSNKTKNTLANKHVQEQMKREEKYAKEQKFYQGSEYNLKDAEVDPESLDKIPVIEPEYDFDMSEGVYSD